MTSAQALALFHALWWPLVGWLAVRAVRGLLRVRRQSLEPRLGWGPWAELQVCMNCDTAHWRAGACPGCGWAGQGWPASRWVDGRAA